MGWNRTQPITHQAFPGSEKVNIQIYWGFYFKFNKSDNLHYISAKLHTYLYNCNEMAAFEWAYPQMPSQEILCIGLERNCKKTWPEPACQRSYSRSCAEQHPHHSLPERLSRSCQFISHMQFHTHLPLLSCVHLHVGQPLFLLPGTLPSLFVLNHCDV